MLPESEVEGLSRAVSGHYPHICKGVADAQEVIAHECNNKNYQVRTQRGSKLPKLLLKKFVALRDPKRISEILGVIDYCHAQGAKVPRLLKTDAGELFFKEGDSYYCAFEFYEGHHFSGSVDELRSAAQGLASLHKVLEGYDRTLRRRENELYQSLTDDELEKVRAILGGEAKEDFARAVLDNLDEISKLYNETEERLSSADLPRQLIHNDFHIMNGLFRGGELVVILDFDSVGTGEKARDVAFSCYRFSRHTRKGLTGEGMIPRASEFLDNYRSQNPLTEEEVRAIPTLLTHEALKRVSYILRSHYFHHDTTWSFDLSKHLRTIEDARRFTSLR